MCAIYAPVARRREVGRESGDPELWQARITKAWRFYFTIEADQYVMKSAREHAK